MKIKNWLMLAIVASFMAMVPSKASALLVQCPNPIGTADRSYTMDSALDCVYGGGNININPATDSFLLGQSTVEDSYVAPAPFSETPTFGVTWTPICTSGQATNTCTGLSITNLTTTTATFDVTNTSFAYYALGVADGGTPKYAVFLLDPNDPDGLYQGAITSPNGSWSHFTLYGFGTPDGSGPPTSGGKIPEPSALLLLGTGLVAVVRFAKKHI